VCVCVFAKMQMVIDQCRGFTLPTT
jgi:hypothetical protein